MPVRILTLLALPALLLAPVGCEIADPNETEETAEATSPATSTDTASTDTTGTDRSSTPATDGATSVDLEQAEWDSIQWYTASGPSCKGATQVMTLSASVKTGGEYVSFTFNSYPWSDFGLVHFFVWDGTRWKGGKFDWIRKGGQGLKGTENIREHYNGLSIPKSGTAVAFAWTNEKGTQRSNLSRTTWP